MNEYNSAVNVGAGYEITNVKAVWGYKYDGVSSGALSGTVGASGTTVVLNFSRVVPTAFSLNDDLTMQAGTSTALAATFVPLNTHYDYRGFTWMSSNTDVASVTSNGVVIAASEGAAVITAVSQYQPSLQDSCTITVTKGFSKPKITAVDVNGYDVHVQWNASPLVNSEDVRTYKVALYRDGNDQVFEKTGLTATQLDFSVSAPGSYRVVVTAVNAATGAVSASDSRSFTTELVVSSANRLVMPLGLKSIESSAFEGNTSYGEVVLPDGMEVIGSRAFADCGRLVKVYVPDSVTQIAADAFADSANVVLVCESNNTAAKLARQNGWHYVTQ